MKNKFIKIFLSISVCIVIIISIVVGYIGFSMAKISDAIVEKDIVFIPDKLAKKFHHDFGWTDAFDYWVIKPDVADVELLKCDIEAENWEKLEYHHLSLLSELSFMNSDELSEAVKGEEVYVCFYNWLTDEIITDEVYYEPWMTTRYLFFIYNAETNLYYCIYYSY